MQRTYSVSLPLQRRFVSEADLEQLTGISRRTWQKHRLFKRGPRYYKIHGSIRYELEEVLAWIKTGELRAINVGRKPGAKKPRWRITHEALEAFELTRTATPLPAKARRRRQPAEVIEFYK